MLTLTKKPLFSFLETEIVRCLKKVAMNPPAAMQEEGTVVVGQAGDEKTKKKALDSLML